MAAICKRLLAFGEFELVIFGDDVILEQPVDEWPLCDALLSWHSEGFPLKKVSCKAVLGRLLLVKAGFSGVSQGVLSLPPHTEFSWDIQGQLPAAPAKANC